MAVATLAIRFFVEVLGVAAVGYWGFTASSNGLVRTRAGIGAPAALVILWALVVAPNANNGPSQPQKDIIGTVVLLVVAVALGMSGPSGLAIGFAAVVLVNAALLFVLREEAAVAIGLVPR